MKTHLLFAKGFIWFCIVAQFIFTENALNNNFALLQSRKQLIFHGIRECSAITWIEFKLTFLNISVYQNATSQSLHYKVKMWFFQNFNTRFEAYNRIVNSEMTMTMKLGSMKDDKIRGTLM